MQNDSFWLMRGFLTGEHKYILCHIDVTAGNTIW